MRERVNRDRDGEQLFRRKSAKGSDRDSDREREREGDREGKRQRVTVREKRALAFSFILAYCLLLFAGLCTFQSQLKH